ncbi:MAG: dethiobiotin synthase [Mucispirillum sp.]|nr:dethiobiotin synthase [Mucispirillum sp.]
MAKRLFVTGAGTDVGKTYVSALIVKKMRDCGFNCGYFKPALSGAELRGGKLFLGDMEYVKKISGLDMDDTSVSFAYKSAVSPHLAARLENNFFNMDKVKSDFQKLSDKFEYIVIVGAGGIVCPFKYEKDEIIMTEDIIKELKAPAVLAALCGLGSINSSLLSISYIKSAGIALKAVIFNNFKGGVMEEDNIKTVSEIGGILPALTVNSGARELETDAETLSNLFGEVSYDV